MRLAKRRLGTAAIAFGAFGLLAYVTFEDGWRPHVAAYLIGRSVQSAYHFRFELPAVDRVDVLVLGEPATDSSSSVFQVPAGGGPYSVTRMVSISGSRLETLLAAWRRLAVSYETQALCHRPRFALRFHQGSVSVFETSVCFSCRNFTVPTAPFGATHYGFDATGPTGNAFHAILIALTEAPRAGA